MYLNNPYFFLIYPNEKLFLSSNLLQIIAILIEEVLNATKYIVEKNLFYYLRQCNRLIFCLCCIKMFPGKKHQKKVSGQRYPICPISQWKIKYTIMNECVYQYK